MVLDGSMLGDVDEVLRRELMDEGHDRQIGAERGQRLFGAGRPERGERDDPHAELLRHQTQRIRSRAFLLRSAEDADNLVAASDERLQNALAKRLLSNDRDAHDRILEDKENGRVEAERHVRMAGRTVQGNDERIVLERIFREFVGGASPKQITKRLNHERIKGPSGAQWNPSTIHGNGLRGTATRMKKWNTEDPQREMWDWIACVVPSSPKRELPTGQSGLVLKPTI